VVTHTSVGMLRALTAAVAAVGAIMVLAAGGGVAAAPRDGATSVTTRVSVSSGDAQADSRSFVGGVSADGRYVAFTSSASNLVAGDTNGSYDVFVRDRSRGVTQRVSVGRDGVQANHGSPALFGTPVISADGRYVAFLSKASNLVAGDTNNDWDVFVRDRVAHTTRRVSVGPGGAQADGSSEEPAISANGRYVAFASSATNLVTGNAGRRREVFVRDRRAHVTRRVSVGPRGRQANRGGGDSPAISTNGRYIAFTSDASNLVAGDTNHQVDVFVRDRVAHVTRRVSIGPGGRQTKSDSFTPAISAHGRYVSFTSKASGLVTGDTNGAWDVFVRDQAAQVTERVSVGPGGEQANNYTFEAAISANGRYVAFDSAASNLVAGDTNGRKDVFVYDREAGVTERVSVGPGGAQANRRSFHPAISGDGQTVAFDSLASNLVTGDTNGTWDVFANGPLG
jgi:Tol biopolymer transport system component